MGNHARIIGGNMNKLMSAVMVVLVACAMVMNTGCASYMVYKESKQQVAMRKALITNNQGAIKSLQLGGEPVVSGISVTFGEAISERPWLQAGAAGVDALVAWGAYEGVRAINGDADDDDDEESNRGGEANNNSAGENVVITQGNGNTVTVNSGAPVDPNVEYVPQEE